jgi:hypothetical protein
MIKAPATFPHVGSYALFADPLEPVPIVNRKPGRPRLHLARIAGFGRRGFTADEVTYQITLPLREGVASGTRSVDFEELIDCTPLNVAEAKEMADIQRHLGGRTHLTPKMRAQKERADELEQRARMAILAAPMLTLLANRQAAVGKRRAAA